jgi:hypothetical protein
MQNLCFERECTISGSRSCENDFAPNASFYSIRPKMMFGCVFKHFRTVRNEKMQNLCFGCVFLGYPSCENCFATNTSILLHLTKNDVWKCFGSFHKPSMCEKMLNLCFRTECTISGVLK